MQWIFVGHTKELDALGRKEMPKFYPLMERRRALHGASLRVPAPVGELFAEGNFFEFAY
jgi:hypothetical protein